MVISITLRYKKTSVGRLLVVRAGRLKFEARTAWNPPWMSHCTHLPIRVYGVRGGFRIQLRLYKLFPDFTAQYMRWGETPGRHKVKEAERVDDELHQCPHCNRWHEGTFEKF